MILGQEIMTRGRELIDINESEEFTYGS